MWFRKDLAALVPAALVLVPCVIHTMGDFQETSKRIKSRFSTITPLEMAVAEVREELGEIDSVGYVLDRDARDPRSAGSYYFVTQYAMAPIRVDRSDSRQSSEPYYIIGIFSSVESRKQYLRSNGLKLLKAYRRGVALLESTGNDE